MANHKSAKKRARQSDNRTARNRSVRSRVNNSISAFRAALGSDDKDAAQKSLAAATRHIRKAVSAGVLHSATASRRVSRLARAFNKAQ